jgi:proteasome lid subunit RPN8/RPN11
VSVDVELFRSDDYIRAGQVALGPLLRTVFEPVVGSSLEGGRFQLSFLRLADEQSLAGMPTLVNLRASLGFVQVRIVKDGTVVYRHPHAVREIIAEPLQRLLAERFPEETHWGFGIRGPGLDHVALVRPAPRMEHEIEVTSGGPRPQVFHVEEVSDPQPPSATLADLGVTDGVSPVSAPIGVVLRADAYDDLIATAPFSDEVEEGGFLAGHVYRDAHGPQNHLVEVTAALQAERTGASLLHFTFTGESFLRMSEHLARRGRGERLVGWYHTHLFPASDSLGLSSIDVDLHHGTFRRPWQVAGLVNLDSATRILRFSRPAHADSGMVLAPYWVTDDVRRPDKTAETADEH